MQNVLLRLLNIKIFSLCPSMRSIDDTICIVQSLFFSVCELLCVCVTYRKGEREINIYTANVSKWVIEVDIHGRNYANIVDTAAFRLKDGLSSIYSYAGIHQIQLRWKINDNKMIRIDEPIRVKLYETLWLMRSPIKMQLMHARMFVVPSIFADGELCGRRIFVDSMTDIIWAEFKVGINFYVIKCAGVFIANMDLFMVMA